MAGFGGGCLCGQVRYRVAAEPLAALACHCRYCQYVSGGAEANVVVIPSAALSLKSGDQRSYRSIASSGTEAWRAFCPNCGTPLFAGNAKHPEATAVKVGTLDDPAPFKRQVTSGWRRLHPGISSSQASRPRR